MERLEMEQRTKAFSLRIIHLVGALPHGPIRDVLGRQLLRAGTSIGANYVEAGRASSRKHFFTTLKIAEREAAETVYWLDLLIESGTVKAALLADVRREASELLAILTASGIKKTD